MSRVVRPSTPVRPSLAPQIGQGTVNSGEKKDPAATGGGDGYLQRVAKYIPAEVVAFCILANNTLTQAVADAEKAKTTATFAGIDVTTIGLVVLVLGLVASPLYIFTQREPGDAWRPNAVMATILFPIWAYGVDSVGFRALGIEYNGHLATLVVAAASLIVGMYKPGTASKAKG